MKMKTITTKTLLAAAMTVAMGVESTTAMASLFNPFEVTEISVPGASANGGLLAPNSAGKIVGGYTEVASFTNLTGDAINGTGTFNSSIIWHASDFFDPSGIVPLANQLGSSSINANNYNLHGLFQGGGTFSTVSGISTFTFSPSVSSIVALWIDPSSDTLYNAPVDGNGAWTVGSGGIDDYQIAFGMTLSGTGVLNPLLPTCGTTGVINCGSFGTTTSFNLTSGDQSAFWAGTQNGTSYFTAPNPFYNLSFQAGQFNNFTPTGTQTINGSADVTFGSVPEPESLALLGIGLLGLVITRRGRKQA